MTENNELKKAIVNHKFTVAELAEMITALLDRVEDLEKENFALKSSPTPTRDRGPKSTRKMTDEDASRIKFGDLKEASHKKAAAELGLSYAQIYSCRGGYTFTHIEK